MGLEAVGEMLCQREHTVSDGRLYAFLSGFFGLSPRPTSQSTPEPTSVYWVADVDIGFDRIPLERWLNLQTKNGWRLVTAAHPRYIFERIAR